MENVLVELIFFVTLRALFGCRKVAAKNLFMGGNMNPLEPRSSTANE